MEVEDDVIFAELSRRISLLLMDEEEDLVARCPPVPLQTFSHTIHQTTESSFHQDQTRRREIKGTGVFIPASSSQPRRKNRQGRSAASAAAKFNKNSDSDNNNNQSYNYSFNPKGL